MQIFRQTLKYGHFETWNTKPEFNLTHAQQVHGINIVSPKSLPCEADGLVVLWNEDQFPLAIKTADCMPIVIEGEKGVTFLHAGWKGLADGILTQTEISTIKPQFSYIGPCIHECCFEVSDDFKNNFPNITNFKIHEKKLFFNLVAEATAQLKSAFPQIKVEVAPYCTKCNTKFHSYRRNKTKERNWNIYIKG